MTQAAARTDNSNVPAKLSLRKHFLEAYHKAGPAMVFDACRAEGFIWKTLKKNHPIKYWGVDKRRVGREILKIDAARILSMRGWKFDVVDIDTWGSPFPLWLSMLPNIQNPVTVFLTIGSTFQRGCATNSMMEVAGLGELIGKLPESFGLSLSPFLVDVCLGKIYDHDLRLIECLEADSGNMVYLGLRLEKNKHV